MSNVSRFQANRFSGGRNFLQLPEWVGSPEERGFSRLSFLLRFCQSEQELLRRNAHRSRKGSARMTKRSSAEGLRQSFTDSGRNVAGDLQCRNFHARLFRMCLVRLYVSVNHKNITGRMADSNRSFRLMKPTYVKFSQVYPQALLPYHPYFDVRIRQATKSTAFSIVTHSYIIKL